MNTGRQFVILLLGVVLLGTVGCERKKPQLPPQAQAPAEPIPTPLPAEISETTPPPAPAPAPKETVKAEEPKPQAPKHRRRKPPQTPAVTAQNGDLNPSNNNTIAMARPPANPAAEVPPDTAIAADVSIAQLLHQKQTTTQLLEATEKTLNGLSHSLSHDEEEMVAQIRSYLAQSRKATTDGDFERAYNLATKAHLLSDALVKK